jgi:hypothetical protein
MTETFDQMLLDWLEKTPGMPRRERQALLLQELVAMHTLRNLVDRQGSDAAHLSEELSKRGKEQLNSLAERENKLYAAFHNTLLEVVDVAEARRVAECLTVSTDLDVLYGALDLHCVMTLRVTSDGSRQSTTQFRGVDDIINELSEFQESVLLLRVDSTTSPVRSRDASGIGSNNNSLSHTIAVRGVSPVLSWVVQCEVELEVGTQVTYYADADCTQALFDLRSSFLFSADGAKVERISRELLPRGHHHLDDLLHSLHFGCFHL